MRTGTTILAALCCGALWAALAATPLRAQLRTVPRAKLDSLAHPAVAKGADAMHFERTQIDAGHIGEDDTPPRYTYAWRNEGKSPLVITRIVTTCGCAVATHDKRPVPAGGRGTVTVTYHPKGHPGKFHRRIFVYTQLSDKFPSAILELMGSVTASEDTSADYPHAMGVLRLKQTAVRFADNGKVQVERIECLNTGTTTLHLRAEEGLTPPGITFSCEPASLAPGQQGDLVVRYDPSAAPQKPTRPLPLLIRGPDTPPSGRTLRISIGETE